MKYNLANKEEKRQAFSYFMTLANKKLYVEVKKINPGRTINQNSYLHLIIGAFGSHFGYDMEEAKQIYKEINSGVYRYEKKGRVFWRSSADLDKEEMAKTIDKFIQKAAENDCILPEAENQEWLMHLENDIERDRMYL